MSEPRMGEPIVIGGPGSKHPASLYAVGLEQIGYMALRDAFPERKDSEIRAVYNPEDREKVMARVSMMERMGSSGICWAVPKVVDIVSTKVSSEGREDVTDTHIVGLMGFGLIRSNKSTTRIINFTAEKIFRRPAVAVAAELHVHPDYRRQGIGSLLLTRLAATAEPLKLMTSPAIPVLQGYTSAEEFFRHYNLHPSVTVPEREVPDYFGPGKPGIIRTFDGLSWKEALVNLHERGELPQIEQEIRARLRRTQKKESKA